MGRNGKRATHVRPFTSGALFPGTALHGYGTRDVWLNGVVKDVGGPGFVNTMFAPGRRVDLEPESPLKVGVKEVQFEQFRGSAPDSWGLREIGLRPSTWGSDKGKAVSRGRRQDGNYSTCMPNGDGGRVFIDPKVRFIDTPGAIYGQMPFRTHIQTCQFGKQGPRFPKQRPCLDPPMNVGDMKRKRVRGGCFSKEMRFRPKREVLSGPSGRQRPERSDSPTRPTSSKEVYSLNRAHSRRPATQMIHSRENIWPPESNPIFNPLRMIGVNTRTPGIRGRNTTPALTRTTSMSHATGRYSSVQGASMK